ncbi:polysaccharide pyruvyl transferase family protein [Desulfospira joergensenii]|uniref:polysaccharide pyruvyl transferase family protein n=1 Tax=Desulfospira joergensenii TaxID=53329 RepID=UPI0003B3D619|nr:polysaccharide pyruvyl transferase family protein [Desulfospira joergensenii]
MDTCKTILFAGAYGIENAGDDLPLIVMCEQLRKQHPHICFNFHVLSRHPNSWEEKTYGVKMIKNIEYENRDQAMGKWFNGLNPDDNHEPICRIRQEIKKADILILGAGNWLIDLSIDIFRGPIPLLALYVFLAKVYHKPVMLYGMSAGPLRTEWGRELTGWIIDNADIVTVRDKDSKHLLEDISHSPKTTHLLPDSTIGAQPCDPVIIEKILDKEGIRFDGDKDKIAIGMRNLDGLLPSEETGSFMDELAGCLNAHKDQASYIFIPQSTYEFDDDRKTAKKFSELLDEDVQFYIIQNRYDPRELIGLYGICDLTLSIRLHSAVFSAIAGTPVIAVNYLPKVAGFMDSIKLSDFCVNTDEFRKESILRLIKKIRAEKDLLSRRLKVQIKGQKKRVTQYSDLVSDYF